jgi:hypothetical protein
VDVLTVTASTNSNPEAATRALSDLPIIAILTTLHRLRRVPSDLLRPFWTATRIA